MQNNVQGVFIRTVANLDDTRMQELQGFNEFQAMMAQSTAPSSPNAVLSLMQTVDKARTNVDEALSITAAHPTRANMVDAMRRLSELDLSATLAGKIADKATKGLDRILNLQ